jgi:ABC-type lipoprotein export system ATPase subunit
MGNDSLAAACRDLVQVYSAADGPAHALRGISLDVPARSITAVVGPSGAGKSTLLRLLACLERPTVGEVLVGGRPTAHLSGRARRRLAARHIGYVFQTPSDNLLEYLTVADHVRLAWRMRTAEPRGAVEALLATTSLAGLADVRPDGLSAGEQQRVAFAMAVAGSPALVVADEPTASLDPASTEALVEMLPALVEDGQTLVIATHHPPIIEAADRVMVIRDGTLAAEADGDGELLAVVDPAGRIHLPPESGELFATGRARITVHDGHLRVDPR